MANPNLSKEELQEYIQLMNELEGRLFKNAQEARRVFTETFKDSSKSIRGVLDELKKEADQIRLIQKEYDKVVKGKEKARLEEKANFKDISSSFSEIGKKAEGYQEILKKGGILSTKITTDLKKSISEHRSILRIRIDSLAEELKSEKLSNARRKSLRNELTLLSLQTGELKEQEYYINKSEKTTEKYENLKKSKKVGFLSGLGLNVPDKTLKRVAQGEISKGRAVAESIFGSMSEKSGFTGLLGALGQMAMKGKEKQADDFKGYGKRTLLAPEGTFKINDKDDIIAGTKLFKGDDLVSRGVFKMDDGASAGSGGSLFEMDAADKALMAAGQPQLVAAKKAGEALKKGIDATAAAFKVVDADAAQLARYLNTNYETAFSIRSQFTQIAADSKSIFVNAKNLTQAQIATNQELGVAVRLDDKRLEENTRLRFAMKEMNGEAAMIAADLNRTSLINKTSQMEMFKTRLAQIRVEKAITQSAVDEREVLKDLAKLSDSVRINYIGQDAALAKAAITARAFGMELKDIAGIQDKLLDFNTSIEKQMTAELLMGQNLNLERARYYALTNDLGGLVKELNNQNIDAVKYGKMNRLAQQATAEALGMSTDQLSKTLMQQQVLAALKTDDLEKVKKDYEIAVLKGKKQEFLAQLGDKALATQFDQMSIQDRMSAATERMGLAMEALAMTLAKPAFEAKLGAMGLAVKGTDVVAGMAPNSTNQGKSETYLGSRAAQPSSKYEINPSVGSYQYRPGYVPYDLNRLEAGAPKQADGGLITQTGFAKVDKGELYLGANSAAQMNRMVALLEQLVNKSGGQSNNPIVLKVNDQVLASSVAYNASTVPGNLLNPGSSTYS